MKIYNLLLTTAFFILSFSAWAQSGNLDVVKSSYPQVYTSITQDADKQWGSDQQTKLIVTEGQAKAFLEIMGSQNINGDVMTEAIINNSLPGSKDTNVRIINDLSIKNPFPSLKCDWFKVKSYYEKRAGKLAAGSLATISTPRSYTENTTAQQTQIPEPQVQPQQNIDTWETAPATTPNRQQQTYPTRERETEYRQNRNETSKKNQSDRTSYLDEYKQEENFYGQPEAKTKSGKPSPFNVGIKIGGGVGAMYDMGSYKAIEGLDNLQLKSRMGIVAEGGLAVNYKKGGFFVQNETTVQYMQANFANKFYNMATGELIKDSESKFDNSYIYLQTAFHLGGYYDMGDNVHLIAGVGPYVGFKLSSTYNKYGFYPANFEDKKYENYMKDGEKSINFGVSGVFGVDIKQIRVALYPNVGLSKMQEKESYKPLNVMLGLTYWFLK